MKAKLIITGLLLSLLLIFSGCATTGGYGSGGSRYLYRGYIYGGTGPYWYPGYGYYGYYGDYPYWQHPPGGFYHYPHHIYRGHRHDSLPDHGYMHDGRRFRSHDHGNVGDHEGRHFFYHDEGGEHHGDRDRR